jgi:hypothetical protein
MQDTLVARLDKALASSRSPEFPKALDEANVLLQDVLTRISEMIHTDPRVDYGV